MKFDKHGNLYLSDPGAGISGIPKRVIQMGSDEVVYSGDDVNGVKQESDDMEVAERKFNKLASSFIRRIIPNSGDSLTSTCDNKTR